MQKKLLGVLRNPPDKYSTTNLSVNWKKLAFSFFFPLYLSEFPLPQSEQLF